METSHLATLGGFAFSVNGRAVASPATRKARALMAFLIVNGRVDSARDRLAELFWPNVEPERARDSLSTALHSIRRSLRAAGADVPGFLVSNHAVVRWTADTTVDCVQFAKLAMREDAAESAAALQLYRGDFLEGDYDDWVVSQRERLATMYESVLNRAVKASHDAAAARRLLARNPYDEEAYAVIIEAELSANRRSLAASWVERCRQELSAVGAAPSAAFEERFGSLVHVDPLVARELTLPFVGRTTELALLTARLSDAKVRRGSATLVRGEAGIGKSTFLHRVSGIGAQSGLRVLAASCDGRPSETFEPWRRIFGALESAQDFDVLVEAHAGNVAMAVAEAIAAGLSEPTALIVDDAHVLSGVSLDIFVALSQLVASNHAIVVGTRPEGVSLLRSRLADLPLEELSIGHLDRSDLQSALTQTLGNEQTEVLDTLVARTGGHPLFFTGLLNSLVDSGALARNGHCWLLTKPLDAGVELPDTVRRFIEMRLHERGDVPSALACALALEPEADSDDLGSALVLDETSTLDALDDLLALGLITQPTPGPQFAFIHDLVAEVAATNLNAGRRTSLHRGFARRLERNGRVGTSFRLARHLEAAGEALQAAQCYLKAAEEALELNAAPDAIGRCDAGLSIVERLERAPNHQVLQAALHRTAARAAIAVGNADDAITRARQATVSARAGNDVRESAQGLLDLAAIEGAASRLEAQRVDAVAAADSARSCGDVALEAEALIQQGSAQRKLGLREEAFGACRSAYTLASRCGRSDLALGAMEELLLAQVTWWQFGDALETARTGLGLARRANPLAEAAFLQARGALWYLLDRFPEAESELRSALRIVKQSAGRRRESVVATVHPQPYLEFASHSMLAKIAIARGDWNVALEEADKASTSTSIGRLPRQREALALLRIDALLCRGLPGDEEAAHRLTDTLAEATLNRETLGWSDRVELARARVSGRLHAPDTGAQLRRVIDVLEEDAHKTPLDCDRAFARLADAAYAVGDEAVGSRAGSRAEYYRRHRLALADAAWGTGTAAFDGVFRAHGNG